jgi:galactose mutarotase-like enzyme
MDTISYNGHTLRRWRCGKSTFLAYPEMGARLMNWNLQLGDDSIRDVIYWPELKNMEEFSKVKGGNPILFPFGGRSFDRGEIHFWRAADDVKRPMPIHGIARQSKFKITRLDNRGFAAQLIPSEETQASYPYDYEFEVTYRFEPLGLACEYTLRNLDKQPIPWCPGHHFYFTVPWAEGAVRSDYLIRIPATKTYKQDMVKTGQLLPGPSFQKDEPLNNPALIDVFHTGLKSNTVVFGEKGKPGDIQLKIGSDKVPPPDATVVTWTLDDKAPFFCVEPWMGPANSMEHKLGLQWVAPGQTQSFTVSVAIK